MGKNILNFSMMELLFVVMVVGVLATLIIPTLHEYAVAGDKFDRYKDRKGYELGMMSMGLFIPLLMMCSIGIGGCLVYFMNAILVGFVINKMSPGDAQCVAMMGVLILNGFIYMLAIRLGKDEEWMKELWKERK